MRKENTRYFLQQGHLTLLICSNTLGENPSLKFMQLYTSPTYEDFHSLLVQPEHSSEYNNLDEEKHRFSPIICRGVCDGCQIVWANTRVSEGLTGRSDLPLNTAVGVPICSIGHELYILVLFSVNIIQTTPNSIEYLCSIARAVTLGTGGFLQASVNATVSAAQTDDFVGIWDMRELIRKYSSDIEFHLLPMGSMQKYFDCNELLLFCDLFQDYKLSRDGRFTTKQVELVRDYVRSRSDSVSSENSTAWTVDDLDSNGSSDKCDKSKIVGVEPDFDISDLNNFGDYDTAGVYNVDLNLFEIAEKVAERLDTGNNAPEIKDTKDIISTILHSDESNKDFNRATLHVFSHMSYKLSQSRFHEFMIAVLGMTVFDCSELWLQSSRTQELFLAAAVYRSCKMKKWVQGSENVRLKPGMDLPGRVLETSQSYWDHLYGSIGSSCSNVRKKLAQSLAVCTAFGVPLPGFRGTCGALVFYSSNSNFTAEPLMVMIIEKAVQLMAASVLDPCSLARLDIESIFHSPHYSDSHLSPCNYAKFDVANGNLPTKTLPVFEEQLSLWRAWLNNKSITNKHFTSHPKGLQCDSAMLTDSSIESERLIAKRLFEHEDYLSSPKHESKRKRQICEPFSIVANSDTVSLEMQRNGKYEPSVFDAEVFAAQTLASISTYSLPTESTIDSVKYCLPVGKLSIKEDHLTENQLESTNIHSICKVAECGMSVDANGSNFCYNHRGSRRCQKEGCMKCAQGATKFCIAHGGGRRCTFTGCFKGARDRSFCAAHGGGKRCVNEGCNKSAVGGSQLCTAHGGGKRCQFDGCSKSSQSSTNFCVKHGGGKTCCENGCSRVSELP